MIDYTFSFGDLEAFLLIFVRVSSFVVTAPFFSTTNTPNQTKISFSILFAYLMFVAMPGVTVPSYSTVLGYSILILKEAVTGIIIGLGANLCLSIVQFAGKIADMEIGLSMMQLMNPLDMNDASGFMGTYYQYALVLIMLVTNFHHFFIRALVETYTLIPIGGATFASDKIMSTMVAYMTDYVIISFRLCLPIVASMIMLNAVLGVLAKTSPQMNMFSVGIQIKVLAGLMILFLTIGILPSASDFIFEEMKVMMTSFVEAMQ